MMEKEAFRQNERLKWSAIGVTLAISIALTAIGINWIHDYGLALFLLLPAFMGACPVIIYGRKEPVSSGQALVFAVTTLSLYGFGLMLFAIEGLICILMAFPLALLFAWIGSLVGQSLLKKLPNDASKLMLLLIFLIPLTGFVERNAEPQLNSVVTSIEIAADAKTVWKNVIEFPQLNEPDELLFKAGIAYPINAKIEGSGVGAVRYCNFTTGSFVEPITVWDEPKLLAFDVDQQPEPMKELSFWDIDAPHLHDYFVSVKGQFKLTQLPNGNTLLEGTTWYYHDIKPGFYWKLWSEHIIHKIHYRVLDHIKVNAEEKSNIILSIHRQQKD